MADRKGTDAKTDSLKWSWTFRNDELRISLNGDVVAVARGAAATAFAAMLGRHEDENGFLTTFMMAVLAAQKEGELVLTKRGVGI